MSRDSGNVHIHYGGFTYYGGMSISMAKTIKEERLRWVF
jgi:hypothetical protein